MTYPYHRVIGGILLVSGTTIGAGMLALPIATGLAGFIPAFVLFIIYWLYMTFTAFLLLEVNLWMPEHTNLITMARRTLGGWGKLVSWVVYLFLLYTLTTAYLAGSGIIFLDFMQRVFQISLPAWIGPLPLLLIFGFFVYQGTQSVDYVNRVLMVGLCLTYVGMLAFLAPHVQMHLLEHAYWNGIWMGVSIVSTSFGFHIIIPTLTDYLHRDVKQLKLVILVGSFIPLAAYIFWVLLALGIIPVYALAEGYQQGIDGATLLSDRINHPLISLLSRFFALFAIITSFLGVSMSLFDFLADGLKITKSSKGRLFLYACTFLPPLIFTLTDPRAFLHALEYAGAFGVVILLGLMPVLMVWIGRYRQHRQGHFKTPGGRFALALALTISLFVIALEGANKAGWLPAYFSSSQEYREQS